MTCLYHVSRTREKRASLASPLGEAFMEGDPARMTAMVRKTQKPCFAFKTLGAGRAIGNPKAGRGVRVCLLQHQAERCP